MTTAELATNLGNDLRAVLGDWAYASTRRDTLAECKRSLCIHLAERETGVDHLWATTIASASRRDVTPLMLSDAATYFAAFGRKCDHYDPMDLPALLAALDALAMPVLAAAAD